jgi:hypothetical protein
MSKKPNVWVSPREDGWAVQHEGTERASTVTPTKEEALALGRDMARREEVELVVQRRDGTIESKDSYGRDPNPPKDTEH